MMNLLRGIAFMLAVMTSPVWIWPVALWFIGKEIGERHHAAKCRRRFGEGKVEPLLHFAVGGKISRGVVCGLGTPGGGGTPGEIINIAARFDQVTCPKCRPR